MTDYLAKQNVAGIRLGYNASPGATGGGGALPGMKGIDLQSWRDLLQPRHGEPLPASEGPVERTLRQMQFIPRVYRLK